MRSLFDFFCNFMAFFFMVAVQTAFLSLLLVAMFCKEIIIMIIIIIIIIIIMINFIYVSGYLSYKLTGDTTKRNAGIKCLRL